MSDNTNANTDADANAEAQAAADVVGGLPPEVAAELAAHLHSQLFVPLASNITRLREECGTSMSAQKDILQDSQATITEVIEPALRELEPIAKELESVYAQIDLLESMINRTGESIRQMTSKVERTEQAVRRETRAIDDLKPLPMWKEFEPTKPVFRARDYVQDGRLVDPRSQRERDSPPQLAVVGS